VNNDLYLVHGKRHVINGIRRSNQNIAMAFQDKALDERTGGRTIHVISNASAERFLYQFINQKKLMPETTSLRDYDINRFSKLTERYIDLAVLFQKVRQKDPNLYCEERVFKSWFKKTERVEYTLYYSLYGEDNTEFQILRVPNQSLTRNELLAYLFGKLS